MEIDIILSIMSAFIVGWWIGSFYKTYQFRKLCITLGYDIDHAISELRLVQTLKHLKINSLKVEQVGDMLVLYDTITEAFICQGVTIEELADKANAEKNIQYAAVAYAKEDKAFVFINGVSAEKYIKSNEG